MFLTAGHCVSGATSAEVWFDSGAPIAHPDYADFAAFPATFSYRTDTADSLAFVGQLLP